ncbi:MAG: twin-arginine translocase TatA/TatE family subunit [Planctomycetota bacterium]|nr:twin-arginine translocase TatA/TatE family subunit [Planctomycetota bacterium]MDA1179343.1 twin-arginine translocase TatA/TatE family subunit [Planctomycetota bacterium]
MFGLSVQELLVVGVVAVLLFGKRLPEVAKSLGKNFREFRSGLNDIQAQFYDVDREYRSAVSSVRRVVEDDYDHPIAPKFEPPQFEPPKFEPPADAALTLESTPTGDASHGEIASSDAAAGTEQFSGTPSAS